MIYIVGGKGFVGSAYVRLFKSLDIPHEVVTKENLASLGGTSCDVLINANGNSKKYLAERNPFADFDLSVRSVAETLKLFKAGIYVFLSTGDVYPRQDSPEVTREEMEINPSQLSRYGLHKFIAEQLIRGACGRWLIVRMGGFVGPGLKKNSIFDLLQGHPVRLDPDSSLQFLSTDRAAEHIWRIVNRGLHNTILNIGGQGTVRLRDLHAEIASLSAFVPGSPKIIYELSLRKSEELAGQALPRTAHEVGEFIDSVRSLKTALS